MKITVNNIDPLLRVELSKTAEFVDIGQSPRGVFLQWATSTKQPKKFEKQTAIIKKAIKQKLPIIIFDKYQEMDADEISFLVKAGAFLWEPAINDRMFFSYQPAWGRFRTDPKDIPWDFDEVRRIDLGYKAPLTKKFPSFKHYFEPIAEIGEFKVGFYTQDSANTMNTRVEDIGVTCYDLDHDELPKMTVLLGTEQEYKTGYLDPNLFAYLEAGVVPLLPAEHRWYYSIFRDLVIHEGEDIEFFLRTHDKVAFGSIYDIYTQLSINLPEANVVNVAKRILTFFK